MVTEPDHLSPIKEVLLLLNLLHGYIVQGTVPHTLLLIPLLLITILSLLAGSVGDIPFDAPLEEFHSKKVVNKLIQQIHDPVVLASGALPEWTHQLTTSSPFLFPFEARELFFHCTAFGTSRSVILVLYIMYNL